MTKTDLVRPAPEGTVFEVDGATYVVGPACNSKHGGAWRCITHDQGFANQMQMAGHTMRGGHLMVWVCYEHGPEVP